MKGREEQNRIQSIARERKVSGWNRVCAMGLSLALIGAALAGCGSEVSKSPGRSQPQTSVAQAVAATELRETADLIGREIQPVASAFVPTPQEIRSLFPKLYQQFSPVDKLLFSDYKKPEQGKMPPLEVARPDLLDWFLYTAPLETHRDASTGQWDANVYKLSLEEWTDRMNRFTRETYNQEEALQAVEETFSLMPYTQFRSLDVHYDSANLVKYIDEAVKSAYTLLYFQPSKQFVLLSFNQMGGGEPLVVLANPQTGSWTLKDDQIQIPVYAQNAESELQLYGVLVLEPNAKAYEVDPEYRSAYSFSALLKPEEAGLDPKTLYHP